MTKIHEEQQYLDLLKNILDNGVSKGDRTGVGTKSIFGTNMRFSLRDSFPILTTKKVYWKGVVEELLWFIRGETDSKLLEAKGVNIWKGNTSREFLDKKGHKYPEGEIGPGYGFQWRHFGGFYQYVSHWHPEQRRIWEKTGEVGGVDQLQNVVNTLRTNPNDRRMIVTAWNPDTVDDCALPPCHMMFQFYVANGELSCMWTQRSVDSFLGLPFNISSYALLTCLIAKITGLKPGDLIYSGGDTHVYNNHFEQAKEQIAREPFPFPQLIIKKEIATLEDIEAMEFTDFELVNYQSHKTIKADMAV